MLSMHRIKSQVEDITDSINELTSLDISYTHLKAKLSVLTRLYNDLEHLDDMLYSFGDKLSRPVDSLTSYDLNSCQAHLNDLEDLAGVEHSDSQLKDKLDSLHHTWNKVLDNFMLWFKDILGENLIILKDDLTFADENNASAFLEMIKQTLRAEALLFSQEHGQKHQDNRASLAFLSSGMQYGNHSTNNSTHCSMRVASESGKVVTLSDEPNQDDQNIMQVLGWKINNPKQWQRTSNTSSSIQSYLNYKSHHKSDQISFSPQNTLQFSNLYHTKPPAVNCIPELPLGIALACAQKLIDDKHIAETDVFTENGKYGVLNDSNLIPSNFSVTVTKLDNLFSCFLETYHNLLSPSSIPSPYKTPSLMC